MRRPLSAVVLVLVLAGCSGDSSPAPQPLSAAEWRREANAVCLDIGRRVRAIPQPRDEEKILEFTAAVTPLWKREEESIRALVPPHEIAAPAGELADALAEVSVSLLEIHVARERGDDARLADAIERGEAAARTVKLRSRDLRLPSCMSQRIP